jgi:hypothetical protein|nr:MAG TPA_asm: hypothetical protein [Caudoviricetes sp.]
MADPNNDGEENTTPPPTEEEQQTETVNDEIKPKEPEPEPSEPDVSARLDSIEKELAALKAMMDTLGYNDPDPDPDDDGDGDNDGESIEDLFD